MNCLKVNIHDGEKAIKLLDKLGLRLVEFKVLKKDNFLFIPVKQLDLNVLDKIRLEVGFVEVVQCEVEEKPKRKSLVEVLKEKVPETLIRYVPRSFDLVGHIAIIEVPEELRSYEDLIGQALMEIHKNVKTVLAKKTGIAGMFRLRDYRLVAGENQTETIHKEYGCRFLLDVKKTYFSPRLAEEHFRVSNLVGKGEVVVDMFTGVGPFSILIAKKVKDDKVYAVDINPYAIMYLKKNIELNRVEGKIIPILGDIEKVVEQIGKEKANRVIMNLPENSYRYLKTACNLLMEKGIIHFYCFENEPNPLEEASKKLKNTVWKVSGRLGKIIHSKLVKQVAPRKWMVSLDFLLNKE